MCDDDVGARLLWRVLGVYGSGGLGWVSLFCWRVWWVVVVVVVFRRGVVCGWVINAKRDGSVNAGGSSQWQYLIPSSILVGVVVEVAAGLDHKLMDQIGRDLDAWVCVCVVRAWNVAKVDRQTVVK